MQYGNQLFLRVLRIAIEWGRYDKQFEYVHHTGSIHLPRDDEERAE